MTGLGITTVSRALKDAPDISHETKERVRLVARQIGYQPNRAGVRLRTWEGVRQGKALTGTLTHELEARFNWDVLGQGSLPLRTPEEGAHLLADLASQHDFTFYKYQLADLISHTGQIDLARAVFHTIEAFVARDEGGRERVLVISVEGSAPRERRYVSWLPVDRSRPAAPVEIPEAAVMLDAA